MLISIVLNLTNTDCHWVDWLISNWAGERVLIEQMIDFVHALKKTKQNLFFP